MDPTFFICPHERRLLLSFFAAPVLVADMFHQVDVGAFLKKVLNHTQVTMVTVTVQCCRRGSRIF
ncbi:hypothetical protein DPMN_147631 [Dreissena polymorpha]|uniref:Uncharacterized protein n=1 Tax=Dreissena polymorpha TaxID=45954 RepID=A0A9D4FCH5_DREPO|nr:hypothetical protein DPMN_147631 [Dreissena polymorpha]